MAKVTISRLRTALKEAQYKPREKYKFIVELENPEYCMCKAMELISNARTDKKGRQLLLTQAISLLATAKVQFDASEKRPPRSKDPKSDNRVS